MLHGDYVKMCDDFAPYFGYKRTGFCVMTTHPLTLPFFDQKQLGCHPSPALLFCFPN
jgi:hypothetical protein